MHSDLLLVNHSTLPLMQIEINDVQGDSLIFDKRRHGFKSNDGSQVHQLALNGEQSRIYV